MYRIYTRSKPNPKALWIELSDAEYLHPTSLYKEKFAVFDHDNKTGHWVHVHRDNKEDGDCKTHSTLEKVWQASPHSQTMRAAQNWTSSFHRDLPNSDNYFNWDFSLCGGKNNF